MGMFDYLRCEMPLPPEPPPPDGCLFQTKDVPTPQLYMEEWVILADGRLKKAGVRYEDRSDKTAPEGSFERLAGCMTPIPDPEKDQYFEHHGDIAFYHYDDKTKAWWEYVARFTDGRCVKIWLSEHEAPGAVA